MATTKNITMKQFNGTDYDTLYPKTVYNQVSGVAPAGYGLGESTPTLISNCNIVGNGWYRVDASTANIPDVGLTSGVLRIDEATGSLIYQSLYFYVSGKVHKMERVHFSGTWYPWEWVNPHMQLSVEYRTGERYNGKPVYAKLLNFGALPNSTSKSFAHGISSLGYVVDIYGQGVAGQDVKVSVDTTNITITSTSNLSAVTAYPVIKYTKTTD